MKIICVVLACLCFNLLYSQQPVVYVEFYVKNGNDTIDPASTLYHAEVVYLHDDSLSKANNRYKKFILRDYFKFDPNRFVFQTSYQSLLEYSLIVYIRKTTTNEQMKIIMELPEELTSGSTTIDLGTIQFKPCSILLKPDYFWSEGRGYTIYTKLPAIGKFDTDQ